MHKRIYVKPGHIVEKELPYSEVCMSMRVAGKRMQASIVDSSWHPGMAQLYYMGCVYSGPITYGEAGFYKDDKGFYYYDESITDDPR